MQSFPNKNSLLKSWTFPQWAVVGPSRRLFRKGAESVVSTRAAVEQHTTWAGEKQEGVHLQRCAVCTLTPLLGLP